MTGVGWKSWIVTAATVGAGVGLVIAARKPHIYRSEALVSVVRPRVPDTLGRPAVTPPMSTGVESIRQLILTRPSLERLSREFNLYPEERRQARMEEVFARMRSSVDITGLSDDVLRVSFVGDDSRTVMEVAQRLASLIIQANQFDRERLAQSQGEIRQAQLDQLDNRLSWRAQELNAARHSGSPEAETLAIEHEVIEATFKDLLTKGEDSAFAAKLDRPMVEQFTLLEPAREAERPFSPDRRIYAGTGAVAGLAAGLLLSFVIRWTRSTRRSQPPATSGEA